MSVPKVSIAVLIGAIVILTGASLLVLFQLSLRVSRDAETTLGAYRLVLEVLADYATESGGRWPKSWDELLHIRNDGYVGLRWPEEVAEVKKRIRINFDLTMDQVLSMDPEHFTAVEQTGPNYGPYPWLIAKFLEDARRGAGRMNLK
jgi:hypothetical protein